ncbi:phage minor structural protein, partial [Cooperia oncophora]
MLDSLSATFRYEIISGPTRRPFDHSADGLERCALLRVHARVLDDVDCEATPRNQMPVRFICERSGARHKEQQLSKNFIWGKLEQLFDFFGFCHLESPAKERQYITDDDDEDYEVDAINKYNATSTERKMLRKLKVFETSSEEEREVLEALRSLNKAWKLRHEHAASWADEVTSTLIPTASSTTDTARKLERERLVGSTTPIKTQSKAEELSTTTVQEETETASNALPSTEESKKLTTEEGTTESPAVDESTSEASSKAASFTGASTTEEKTSEQAGTEESTTEVPTTLESVSQSSTAAESTTEGSSVEKADNASVRAHAVPLREITEVEGSGTTVERSQVEKESKPIRQTEIDPEKLEKIINTMEKMVANLENISIVEKGKETKLENDKDSMQKEKEIRKKEETKEDSQKSEINKKEKPIDSLVRISEKVKDDGAGQAEMEKDFDEKLNQNM